MEGIKLYAELLPRVRSVNLYGEIQDGAGQPVSVSLAPDRTTVTVQKGDRKASIQLPATVSPRSAQQLLRTVYQGTEFSQRFELDGTARHPAETDLYSFGSAVEVPWMACHLNASVEIECAQCNTVVMERGKMRQWKDLPGSHWAEMQDFWHCHKPPEKNKLDHGQIGKAKGYANNVLQGLGDGVGFADVVSLVISPQDAVNIKFPQDPGEPTVRCANCKSNIGQEDSRSPQLALDKWAIHVNLEQSIHQSYQLDKWMSALWLTVMGVQSGRKIIFRSSATVPDNSNANSAMIWIFTPDLIYSSAGGKLPAKSPTQAVKILWKMLRKLELEKLEQHDIEQCVVGPAVFRECMLSLEVSQRILPGTAKTFKDWNVGLMNKFNAEDMAPSNPQSRKDAEIPGFEDMRV